MFEFALNPNTIGCRWLLWCVLGIHLQQKEMQHFTDILIEVGKLIYNENTRIQDQAQHSFHYSKNEVNKLLNRKI